MKSSTPLLISALLASATGCGSDDDIWTRPEWNLRVRVDRDHVRIEASVADVHGDFVHMSIRKLGHDNRYTVERSPDPAQPERDWSRVHRWFGELHPDTYLEGRIDDGGGQGPPQFTTYVFQLSRNAGQRQNWRDQGESEYVYITRGYHYADGALRHPGFGPGQYEVEIYAWYTGSSEDRHPATGGRPGVQYVHFERPLVSTVFAVE